MLGYFISFLILLNPFALFIYVIPIKKDRGMWEFTQIMLRATLISTVIYILFALLGQRIFQALSINFEAFRIFGGVVLVSFALAFILQGKQSMITTRGELSKVAAEVALPFIVGAGTITFSILVGEAFDALSSIILVTGVLLTNFFIVLLLAYIRHRLKPRLKIVFDKNAEILLRINGFIVGAYGVSLMVTGIKNLFG